MNVAGIIGDYALRERLRLMAAGAGWRCALAASTEALSAELPDLEPVDLLLGDDAGAVGALEAMTAAPQAAATRVLLAAAGTDAPSGVRVVDPVQDDPALLHALKTCVNTQRFRARFAEIERTEPITSLPRHEELFRSLSTWHGRPLGLAVVQIDHAAHLYDDLDPVSKTDLLAATAAHLSQAMPSSGRLGFFDAACFVVALPGVDEAELARLADALVHRMSRPLTYRRGELHLTVSVGYAFEAMYGDPDRLWSQGWRAMRRALENGGNRAAGTHTPGLSHRLPQALEREEFSLVLQPQVTVDSQQLAGAEALLRWQGMEVGELGPNQFIPLAEQRGHMARIGDWVLDQACREAANWLEHLVEPLTLGINVSPQQFHNSDITQRIGRYRSESWFDPAMLELELPQEAMLTLVDEYRDQLYRLRDWGVRFALDNLGSTLIDAAKLLRCPADTLKVDRSLVSRMDEDPEARELVAQICQLGSRFDLRVVAVGVERQSQLEALCAMGCTLAQGFLFSPPVSLGQFRVLLSRELDGQVRDQKA